MGRYDPRRLAPVAELVDAADSKSVGGDIVLVRVRPGAPLRVWSPRGCSPHASFLRSRLSQVERQRQPPIPERSVPPLNERGRRANPLSMERTDVLWNERPLCRLSDMTTDTKEQRLLWEAALSAIGRALKHEFENERQEVPDRISRLLVELEAKGKTARED
jgi:hypothetical protein